MAAQVTNEHPPPTPEAKSSASRSRQLDLVLDDARLRRMTPNERQGLVKTLAALLLEASGIVVTEAGHDNV